MAEAYNFEALEPLGVDAPASASRSDEPLYERQPYTGELPVRVAIVLEVDADARDRFEGLCAGLRDPSDSAIDLSLARLLAEHGLTGAEIEHAIRFSREEVRHAAKRQDDRHFVRTVNRAIESSALEQIPCLALPGHAEPGIAMPHTGPPLLQSGEAAQESVGWPDPTPLDAPPVGPPVPLDCFPSVLRDHIAATAQAVQIPVEIPAILALATFATAAQRVATVRLTPSLVEQLSLYAVGVAEPSERKSATYRAMTAALFSWESRHNAAHADRLAEVARQRRSIAGRVKTIEAARNRAKNPADTAHFDEKIAELERTMPPEAYPVQLTVQDITVERMAEASSQQGGCIALLNEEGGTFFNTLVGRYDSTGRNDLDCWLQGYDGGRLQVERMSRKLLIERPRTAIGLVVQPDVLKRMSETPGLEERGLMSRFCFVWGPSLVGQRTRRETAADVEAAQLYAHALESVLELPVGDVELQLTPEAADLWWDYYLRIETALPGGLMGVQAWGGKHSSRAGRIAAIFHLARYAAQRTDSRVLRTPIDVRTMQAAIGVADWLLGHALAINERLFGDGSLIARAIRAWAQGRRLEETTGRDVFRQFRRLDRADVEAGLFELERLGWARLTHGSGRNKFGMRVQFHPSILKSSR